MKKRFKIVLSCLFAFIIVTCCMLSTNVKASGETVYGGNTDWSYTIENGYAIIRNYNGNSQDVKIPSEVNGYIVKALEARILPYSTHVLSVTIPSTVEEISPIAFETGTDSNHFALYGSLQNIYVDEGNPYFSSIDGILYDKDKIKLVRAPEGRNFGKYTIPSNVVEIDKYAFAKCSGLTELVISASVKKLGDYAFFDCNNLVSVNIEDGLVSMGSLALADCSTLKRIDLPRTLMHLDVNFPFIDNNELEQINVNRNNPFFTSIDGVLFNKRMTELLLYPSNKQGTSYTVPSTVEKITYFEKNINISSIVLPNGLKEIRHMDWLESLTYLTLPETLEKLGEFALAYNKNLKEITIPASVNFIGEFALYNCDSLGTVTILNKNCVILESKDVITATAKIKGYIDSTAYDYAYAYGRIFVDIETNQEIQMIKKTTDLLNFLPKDKKYFAEPAYGSMYVTNEDGVINRYIPNIIHESNIQRKEYVELKNFTDNLVKDCSTDMEKVKAISNWVYNNIEYSLGSMSGNSIESVYSIFEHKYGNCMCFSQLTNYMLYLEGIPAILLLATGHECGAALVDNEWILVDSNAGRVGRQYLDDYDVEEVIWADGVLTYNIRNLKGIKVASIGYSEKNEKEVEEITIPYFVSDLYSGLFSSTADDLIVHGTRGGNVEKAVKKEFQDIRYNGTIFTATHKIEVSIKKKSYVYNGKKKKPSVIVKVGSKVLKKGKDYKLVYKNNQKVGIASVVISGTGKHIGKYIGKVTKKFKIVPRGTSLSKAIVNTNGFTLSWKKQAKSTDGYQLQYSTSKKFTKKTTVTRVIKRLSKTKLDVKKCRTKKKYYIRIRTYKIVKGKKYYSSWSRVGMITTKNNVIRWFF